MVVAGMSSVSIHATSTLPSGRSAIAKARSALILSGWARARNASARSASVCLL